MTPEDPLRVWVIGDSLAGGVGYALGARGRATGLIVTSVHGEGGTGLVRPDVFDWPAFVAENRGEADPDVVVVILGANDGQAMVSPHQPAEFGSPEWDSQYAALVDALAGQLLEFAGRVYWVSVPIMADPGYDNRVRHVNRILLQRAGLRFAVRYVDAYTLFQDRSGHYAMEIIENGVPVKVRADDGIHFSPEGADRLARLLMRILEEEWLQPAGPAG